MNNNEDHKLIKWLSIILFVSVFANFILIVTITRLIKGC
jgi:hypothetical protein